MNKIKELLNEENNRLITIAARPGVGKSIFLRNILDLIDGKILYFELELNQNSLYEELNKIGVKNKPIVYDKPNISVNEIETTIRRLYDGENITTVIIDYLQLIDNKYDEDIIDILNKIANQLGITIIVINQLSKLSEDKEINVPLLLEHFRNNNKSILKYSNLILLLTCDGRYEDNIVDIKIQVIKNNVKPICVENVKLDKEKGLIYNE